MKNIFRGKGGQKITLISIGIVLILASIVLITWFFLKGQTTVTGDFDEDEYYTSLTCKTEGISYPFFEHDNAIKKETEVTAIFKNDGKLDSIAFTQKMYYANGDKAKGSEAINHASMNKSFGSVLGPDALNANYYSDETMMRMRLYTSGKEYSSDSRKYFLIDTASQTIDNIERNYVGKGFECNKIINN